MCIAYDSASYGEKDNDSIGKFFLVFIGILMFIGACSDLTKDKQEPIEIGKVYRCKYDRDPFQHLKKAVLVTDTCNGYIQYVHVQDTVNPSIDDYFSNDEFDFRGYYVKLNKKCK